MASWDKAGGFGLGGWTLAASLTAAVLLAWVVFFGSKVRSEPRRCGDALLPMETRCCAPGQGISAGRCVGVPSRCKAPFVLVEGPTAGCALVPRRVLIEGGSVTLGPTDWDSADLVTKQSVSVHSFYIDESEVNVNEYERCVRGGLCKAIPSGKEPGLPVTGVSFEAASDYCAFRSGRLPTPAEWVFAASGPEARRFPWGAHGLVCRRAVFGLVTGPCAEGGILPDLAGSRAPGRSSEGVLDLSGNVAEWSLSEEGKPSVHGGSFRSKHASDLKVWSQRKPVAGDDVGFRCVYPVEG